MADKEKTLESIRATKTNGQKGKSKLLSPDPERKKLITEILHAFGKRKISFASLVQLDRKKLRQVAEMGYVKLRHGRFDEARKIFEVLTFIDHKNYFHHLSLAGAYQKMRRYVDAAFQYSEVLKLNKDNLNALVNRGEVFLRTRNYRKAAEDFREAILADQLGKDRYSNRARSLVIAIKRSLARDKTLIAMRARGELPQRKKRKAISPLRLVRPAKR